MPCESAELLFSYRADCEVGIVPVECALAQNISLNSSLNNVLETDDLWKST
jgi:hypothetical protein